MKLLIYDLETTGLDKIKHGIHQISYKIFTKSNDGYKYTEIIDIKMRPAIEKEFDPKAMISVTKEEILQRELSEKEGFKQFMNVVDSFIDKYSRTDKFHLVGFNNRKFDDDFLRQWFSENDSKYYGSYFWSDSIDLSAIASMLLRDQRKEMENFKLATVCKNLGIPVNETRLHDSKYDLELTIQLYNIVNRINKNQNGKENS